MSPKESLAGPAARVLRILDGDVEFWIADVGEGGVFWLGVYSSKETCCAAIRAHFNKKNMIIKYEELKEIVEEIFAEQETIEAQLDEESADGRVRLLKFTYREEVEAYIVCKDGEIVDDTWDEEAITYLERYITSIPTTPKRR